VPNTVETRGSTVDEAIAGALRELGLPRDEVDVEVLAEGRRGLLGGSRRARVRVSSKPSVSDETAPAGSSSAEREPSPAPEHQREHQEERVADPDNTNTETPDHTDTDPPGTQPESAALGGTESPPAAEASAGSGVAEDDGEQQGAPEGEEAVSDGESGVNAVDEEAELAADFIEGLLDVLDLPGDIQIQVRDDYAVLDVQHVGSGLLIGRRGATLDALQELVRCAVQRQTERRCHVRVDVEGYRERHVEKLREKCRDAIAQTRESGEPTRLQPMDAYERKLMHDLVADSGGVTSSSDGSEPKRRVVIHPAEAE
jgi:spoIIIJ-associated protein